MVAKPPDGAGANATFRLDTPADFDSWLTTARRTRRRVWLLEEFLTGAEHSSTRSPWRGDPLGVGLGLPAAAVGGPADPVGAVDRVLPRDISGPEYAEIQHVGPAALQALGIRDAFSHMEWFARPDGSVAVSEVGARPPGAQIGPMIGFAHDVDFYATWAELVIKGTFEPPERRYASGTAYLRGMGRGQVRAVHGVEAAPARDRAPGGRLAAAAARAAGQTAPTRVRASSPCGTPTPPWSRTRWTGSSPPPGSSWSRANDHDQEATLVNVVMLSPGLPA